MTSKIEELIPVLAIRKRTDGPSLLLGDSDICLDGVPLKAVQEFTLTMRSDELNTVTLRIAVRDVEVDPEFLVALEAHIVAKK